MNCRLRTERSRAECLSKVSEKQLTGVREGHWSDLAVHCGLFAGPARSSFVAASRIISSQGKLSWFVCRSVLDLDAAGKTNSDVFE